jgi:hypothetical protein
MASDFPNRGSGLLSGSSQIGILSAIHLLPCAVCGVPCPWSHRYPLRAWPAVSRFLLGDFPHVPSRCTMTSEFRYALPCTRYTDSIIVGSIAGSSVAPACVLAWDPSEGNAIVRHMRHAPGPRTLVIQAKVCIKIMKFAPEV